MGRIKSGNFGPLDDGGSCSIRNRFSFEGIPTHCWCGNPVSTFVSKTTKNPFRRFYRCVVAREREGESHLFKWVDDALVEEVTLVEERQSSVEAEVETLVNHEKHEAGCGKDNECLGALAWLCSKFR